MIRSAVLLPSGYVLFLSGIPVAWRAKRQDTTATSTFQAELQAAYTGVELALWYKQFLRPWAITSIFLYPLGVNAYYGAVLWVRRRAILAQDQRVAHLSFLTDHYAPERWYWEPIDSIRRCALTGLLVFFKTPHGQVGFGVVLAYLFQMVYFFADPFQHNPEDACVSSIANFWVSNQSWCCP